MLIVRLLSRLFSIAPPRPQLVPNDVLARDEFRRLISRERNRADRVGSQLSLLLLDLERGERGKAKLAASLEVICQRLRETDAVGWFQRRSLGILLPDTASKGAQRVLEDLRERVHALGAGAKWRIFTYPSEPLPDPQAGGSGRIEDLDAPAGPGPGAGALGQEREEASMALVERSGTRALALERSRSGALEQAKPLQQSCLRQLLLPRRSLLSRSLDVLLATIGLVLAAPLILIAGLAIKLGSPGPVFFRQTRLGQGGRPFTFIKLRTMCVDAEARKKDLLALNEQSGPVFKVTRDPRTTPVGRILRKLSIDELPQLWNVLKGDMTFVGPRPPLPDEVNEYEPWQRRRLDIAGGLTCIWQVSGRSQVQFEDWVRMDLRYARDATFWLDLKILAQTIPAVVTGKGAR